MENLVHYIVVRRDLPLGALLAQTAHAAGESFYLLGDGERRLASGGGSRPGEGGSQPSHPANAGVAQLPRAPGDNPEVAASHAALGSTPNTIHGHTCIKDDGGTPGRICHACVDEAQRPRDYDTIPPKATVVVLGARNEQRLLRLQAQLRLAGIPFVSIREPDLPWCNELMAIGLVPGDRAALSPLMKEFQIVRGYWHEQSGAEG